jgi:hypothetical protein
MRATLFAKQTKLLLLQKCKINEYNILMMVTGILVNNKSVRRYWWVAVAITFFTFI